MIPRRSWVLMLIGFLLLLTSYFMYLALSMPGNLFFMAAISSFELMIIGRMLTANRRELILLLMVNGVFIVAGAPLLLNPNFSFEVWGIHPQWDYFVFMTLLTLAFITAGFLPIRKVEMREYGLTAAFVVSFFYEMFGFPLTLLAIDYLLEMQLPMSGFPGFKTAHLWVTLGILDYSSVHLLSGLAIVAGSALVILGHLTLYGGKGKTVTWGIYKHLKHPQYMGIIVITGGMLIEYPTLPGLAMWAILIPMYARRAQQETKDIARLGKP